MTGFAILKWAAYGGIAAVVVSIAGGIAAWRGTLQHKIILSLAGLVIGLVVAGIPWSWMRTAYRVPHIHDITTDTKTRSGG